MTFPLPRNPSASPYLPLMTFTRGDSFKRTTEGGGEDDVSTVDKEAVVDIQDSVGGTSGAGVGDLESTCQDSGKVQSTVEVTYQQYLKSRH